jgi:type IV pilus assembly protein PilP
MMSNHSTISARWLAMLSLTLALTACGSAERELQAYIDQVKARPGQPIEPLPEVRPPPSFVYEAGDRRSPFVPDVVEQSVAGQAAGIGPDRSRPREFLEQEPLDSLTMVGTLRDTRGYYALIQDDEQLVHRVTIGNYLGQNHGRIMDITESEVFLDEIVADGLGGYVNRPASIGLND